MPDSAQLLPVGAVHAGAVRAALHAAAPALEAPGGGEDGERGEGGPGQRQVGDTLITRASNDDSQRFHNHREALLGPSPGRDHLLALGRLTTCYTVY